MSQDRRAPLAPIAVIRSESPSLWGSCKTIVPNLEAAYRPAQKAQFFSFEPGMDPSRVWALAESIARSRPERIVFLDHLPHPAELLGALAEVYGKRPLPPVAAHLYGDFTLHTDAWLGIEPLLRKS
ncbi:MAG: hypothetical protein ACXWP5_15180, partial [Bdellovibrionota bacterium]